MPSTKGHVYYRDLLETHLEGGLSPAERDVLFGHLEHCDECRRTLEAEERLTARLQNVPKLVAPSDLRASILQQAMRERQERVTPVLDDQRLAGVLRGTAIPADPDKDDTDDLPVFAGVTRPRRSRARQVWRRASPYAAYTFLAFAATGALYTGTLRGVPGADYLQATLHQGFQSLGTLMAANTTPPLNPEPRTLNPNVPDTRNPTPDTRAFPPSPIPDPRVVAWVEGLQRRAQVARDTLTALAAAAERPLPRPAEQSGAQIAALVLRTTNPAVRMGFERDELHEAIQQAGVEFDEASAPPDQFAYEGHRYRTYVVRVASNRVDTMMQCLEQYRVPEDGQVVKALTDQNRLQPRATNQLAFFSSRCEDLCHALEGCAPRPDPTTLASADLRDLQIIVVE